MQTAMHINPKPCWNATENDWVSTNPVHTHNRTQTTDTWTETNTETNGSDLGERQIHATHTNTHATHGTESLQTQQGQQALTDRTDDRMSGPGGPPKTVRENMYGQGYGDQRQDDDTNTTYNTPDQCVSPTYRYTHIYNRNFHKKIGVSIIVERQRYTTINKLTPISKKGPVKRI